MARSKAENEPVKTTDSLPDVPIRDEERGIGWLGYVGVAIGSFLGYILFRVIHGGPPSPLFNFLFGPAS
jgi:hypothetical protein